MNLSHSIEIQVQNELKISLYRSISIAFLLYLYEKFAFPMYASKFSQSLR